MGNAIKFTIDGKDYSTDIEGGLKAYIKKATEEKLKDDLGPILKEIEGEGGTISIDIDKGYVSVKNCSDGLIAKVQAAIKRASL